MPEQPRVSSTQSDTAHTAAHKREADGESAAQEYAQKRRMWASWPIVGGATESETYGFTVVKAAQVSQSALQRW